MGASLDEVAPSEGASHLRDWVLQRVRAGGRVALLGPAPDWVAPLEAAGQTVLQVSLEDRAPLVAFAPTHVVLPLDASWPLETGLEVLREVPGAELLFGFWNTASAALLLSTLVGRRSGRAGPSDAEVSQLLSGLGFQVRERRAFRVPPGVSGLAASTEGALQSLLGQLNASAGEDLLFYAVVPGGVPTPVEEAPVSGLLSVVVRAASHVPAELLDETLFSLACQEHRPVEVLLLGGIGAANDLALARHGQLAGGAFLRVAESPEAWDEALRRVRGQYVAFLEAGTVVYPAHYPRLIEVLRRGSAAWSMARAFRATFASGPTDGTPYIESKRPFPLGEILEWSHLLQEPELFQSLVVDRTRVGPMSLVPTLGEGQGAPLPVRLAALFEPVFVAEGLATCEVRSASSEPPASAPPSADVQLLTPLVRVAEGLARAHAAGSGARGLRFRVVDDLNTRLRERLPWLHGALRSMARGSRR